MAFEFIPTRRDDTTTAQHEPTMKETRFIFKSDSNKSNRPLEETRFRFTKNFTPLSSTQGNKRQGSAESSSNQNKKRNNPCYDCYKKDECWNVLSYDNPHATQADLESYHLAHNGFSPPTFESRKDGYDCFSNGSCSGYDWRDNNPRWSGFYET